MAGLGSVPNSKNNGNELSNRKDDNDKVRNFRASRNRPGLEVNRCNGLAEFRLGPPLVSPGVRDMVTRVW